MHAAWEIILQYESFWEYLDDFRSLVLRGVCKKIKQYYMKLKYLEPVIYKRFKDDLDKYMLSRRFLKLANLEGVVFLRPPPSLWHPPGKMLMVNWTHFLTKEVDWDFAEPLIRNTRHFSFCYW